MEQLRAFIKFIEENPKEEKGWYNEEKWIRELNLWNREWKKIVLRFYNDAGAWSCVEETRPKRGYDNLCHVLIQTIGVKLAREWSNSSDSDQRSAVVKWCCNRLDLWTDFNATIKNMVLTELFSRHESASEKYLHGLNRLYRYMDMGRRDRDLGRSIIDAFPQLPECPGYVTPPEIENLLDFVCKAGDKEYEDKIRRRIHERKVAFGGMSRSHWQLQSIMGQRIPCNPNENERELIAHLLDIPATNGYRRSALPEILLSSETPPIFVSEPKLEEADNQEKISIEELLGVYRPRQEQIIIWEKGIQWLARRSFDEKWLFAVVLIHELGHWITHTLPKPGSPFWETSSYMLAEEDVHEGWAQLMTSWVADRVEGEFKQTFDDLNKRQSATYQVFKKYMHEPQDKMMSSLEKLRSLPWPARLQDWEESIKS